MLQIVKSFRAFTLLFIVMIPVNSSAEISMNKQKSSDTSEKVNEVKIIDGSSLPWINDKEPKKSKNNIQRIKFSNNLEGISEEKIRELISKLEKLKKNEKIKISSKSHEEKDLKKAKQNALIMISKLEKAFVKENYKLDYDNITYFIYPKTTDKPNFSYIDIDKF